MKLGDVVKHYRTGIIGTVEYSRFGFSIHEIDENGILCKWLGDKKEEVMRDWEVIDIPLGYKIGCYGGLVKYGNKCGEEEVASSIETGGE